MQSKSVNKQRPILLVILVIYIFVPGILQWAVNEEGHWTRPFAIWLLVIAIAFVVQYRKPTNDL